MPYRRSHKGIGFVPTMGYLHDGHRSLIRAAAKECDTVVVSIFVNPTQFAPHEDFSQYPRDIHRDTALVEGAGAGYLFVPSTEEMYSSAHSTSVIVEGLSSMLEGEFRPTHFKGVTTIVMKLLNIVQPQRAYFGQKDFQQSVIIQRMVDDLNIPVVIDVVPTVREHDGLAMSSRNKYLTDDERKAAPVVYQSLKAGKDLITAGERNSGNVIEQIKKIIQTEPKAHIDYVSVVERDTCKQVDEVLPGVAVVIALAVRFGSTRLIDNIIVQV